MLASLLAFPAHKRPKTHLVTSVLSKPRSKLNAKTGKKSGASAVTPALSPAAVNQSELLKYLNLFAEKSRWTKPRTCQILSVAWTPMTQTPTWFVQVRVRRSWTQIFWLGSVCQVWIRLVPGQVCRLVPVPVCRPVPEFSCRIFGTFGPVLSPVLVFRFLVLGIQLLSQV